MASVSASRQRAYRLMRRYGLTPEQYDALKGGATAPCGLCQRTGRLGAFRVQRTITGFVCWGCRRLLGTLKRFPHQRKMLGPDVQLTLATLLPLREEGHATDSPFFRKGEVKVSNTVKGVSAIEARIAQVNQQDEDARK